MINCLFNPVFDPHPGFGSCVTLLKPSLALPAANTKNLSGINFNSFAGPEGVSAGTA